MSRLLAREILNEVAASRASKRLTFTNLRARERMRAALYAARQHDRRLSQMAFDRGDAESSRSAYEDVLIHTEGQRALIVRFDDGEAPGLVSEENLTTPVEGA